MAKTPLVKINPIILEWARSSLGLTLEEASKKSGVSLEKYTAWEAGEEYPSFAQLKKIANGFKRPSAVFFLQDIPIEESSPRDFRLLSEFTSEKISSALLLSIRHARRKRRIAMEIAEEMGMSFKKIDIACNLSSKPEEVALEARLKMNFQLGAQYRLKNYDFLNYLKEKLEEFGVLIFQSSESELYDFRGLALYYDDFPIIILNSADTVNGRLFSLMHEFCHILLGMSGICNMEIEGDGKSYDVKSIELFCNQFAADFLVPTNEFKIEIQKLPSSEPAIVYETMAKKFNVSREVILRKMFKMGLVTRNEFFILRDKLIATYRSISKQSRMIPQSVKAIANNGRLFTRLVIAGYHQEKYNDVKVSDYLQVKGKHINSIEESIFKKAY